MHDAIRIRSESAGPIRPEPRKCSSVDLFAHPCLDMSQNRLCMEYREFETENKELVRQPPSNISPDVLRIKTPRHKLEPMFEVQNKISRFSSKIQILSSNPVIRLSFAQYFTTHNRQLKGLGFTTYEQFKRIIKCILSSLR